ncbi:hypothetical protein [Bradyrhizobium sp. JR3.5]
MTAENNFFYARVSGSFQRLLPGCGLDPAERSEDLVKNAPFAFQVGSTDLNSEEA